ncbi:hypothetical protein P692DRAFT_20874376 [Suillus brevipes Sb2]|nr:hypothetical protein P692DRAFT_20874376 [Suillus brevipes Sb2]
MPPLPIHEQPAAHLMKAVNNFTEAIPYNRLLINITVHLNHRIQNKDFTNIPDLHLTVTAQPPDNPGFNEMEIAKLILKWVRESGLSSDTDCMPKEGSITTQQLCSAPSLDYEEFIPARIKKSLKFGLVEIASHIWIDISEVHYSIYKCGTDGHFDFNNKDAATFTEGTLHPILQMGDTECMLDDAAVYLKRYIVSLMEGMGLEESEI